MDCKQNREHKPAYTAHPLRPNDQGGECELAIHHNSPDAHCCPPTQSAGHLDALQLGFQ